MLVNTYTQKAIFTVMMLTIAFGIQAQVMTLEQCIDTALVHNKTLQMQRNQVEISHQKKEEIKGNLLPKVNVNTDYHYFTNLPYQYMPMSVFGGPEGTYKEAQFGVPHNISSNLQFALSLYNPQIKSGIQTAKIACEIKNLQLKKSEEQIYSEISNLYYTAQILTHQLRFIDSNLSNTQRLLRNIQLLKSQLMATGTDVNKVVLQAGQLNVQRATIQSAKEQAIQTLKFLMGVPSDREIRIDPEIKFEPGGHDDARPTVDMEITAAQYRLLINELSTLRKSALPTIALFGSYGVNGFGYAKGPDNFLKFHPVGFAGVQLTYSLFDGNVLRKKKKHKELELKNNELQQELVAEQNNLQIRNVTSQMSVAKLTIESTLNQISQAQTIYDQTLLQQKEGLANLNDILLAENSLREVQQHYLAAVVDYLKADLELKKLTGRMTIKN